MAWTFYNSSGEELINDGGVQAGSAVFTGKVDLGSNLLVGNAGSTGISISSVGIVQMAAQPSILFYNSSADANQTGNGAWATVDFDSEQHDQNGDFASDTFSAPVTGVYLLTTVIKVAGITVAGTIATVKVTNSGSATRVQETSIRHLGVAGFREYTFTLSMLAGLDANDDVTVTIYGAGESSDVWDIEGETFMSTALAIHLVA